MSQQPDLDESESQQDAASPAPSTQENLGALLSAIPRLFDRSVRQLELASSLLVALTCHAASGPAPEVTAADLLAAGAVQPEPLDVLDVLQAEPLESERGTDGRHQNEMANPGASSMDPEAAPEVAAVQVLESELGVPDYDSLAASQVVPRLVMLSAVDLQAIVDYELAHRRRQTILNRALELLDSSSDESE